MKRIITLLAVLMAALSVYAQEKRDITVSFSDKKGKPVKDLELFVYVQSDSTSLFATDGSEPVKLQVAEDDVVCVVMSPYIYNFPVAGVESLDLVFKNKKSLSGFTENDNTELNTGYGKMPLRNNAFASSAVDVALIHTYNDIASYMQGRVAGVEVISNGGRIDLRIRGRSSIYGNTSPQLATNDKSQGSMAGTDKDYVDSPQVGTGQSSGPASNTSPLILVDGVEIGDFHYVNEMVPTSNIASITVLKDGGGYGARGGAGVVVIVTKAGSKN